MPHRPAKGKTMNRKLFVLLCAALAGSAFGAAVGQETAPSPSDEKVCLQSNRMMNYEVEDEHTLTITDRFFKRYTVRMASGCVGLTGTATGVVLRARTSLGCFGANGDSIAFNSPGLGRLSCFVTSVEPYVPREAKQTSGEGQSR